jgi:hypothetical protein
MQPYMDVFAGERIVDEKTLKIWGYRTVSIEKSQFIKKITKVNKTGSAFYPRFNIYKECYETNQEAKSVIEKINHLQQAETVHRDFDYREGLVRDRCIFFLNTDSLAIKLSFQPALFELFKKYILGF